jgi:hypothetical protein
MFVLCVVSKRQKAKCRTIRTKKQVRMKYKQGIREYTKKNLDEIFEMCDKYNLYSFFLSPTSFYLTSRCRGLFFHVSTHNDSTTVGRTPLDEGSARRRDPYLTTHNTHKRQTSMLRAGYEPAIPVGEPALLAGDRLQTHALDRSATGIGCNLYSSYKILTSRIFFRTVG